MSKKKHFDLERAFFLLQREKECKPNKFGITVSSSVNEKEFEKFLRLMACKDIKEVDDISTEDILAMADKISLFAEQLDIRSSETDSYLIEALSNEKGIMPIRRVI